MKLKRNLTSVEVDGNLGTWRMQSALVNAMTYHT